MDDVHHNKLAGILCQCPAHKEARVAGVRANQIVEQMLAIVKVDTNDSRLDELNAELEKQKRVARQCDDEQQWP